MLRYSAATNLLHCNCLYGYPGRYMAVLVMVEVPEVFFGGFWTCDPRTLDRSRAASRRSLLIFPLISSRPFPSTPRISFDITRAGSITPYRGQGIPSTNHWPSCSYGTDKIGWLPSRGKTNQNSACISIGGFSTQ